MEQLIEVRHVGSGWCVTAEGRLEPTLFRSGGQAEHAARRLACCLAGAGCDTRVLVRDRQDALVGAHRYFAA